MTISSADDSEVNMKYISFFLLSLSLGTSVALADQKSVVCGDRSMTAKFVFDSADQSSVLHLMQSPACLKSKRGEPISHSLLSCQQMGNPATSPDFPMAVLSCSNPHVVDAGMQAELSSPDFAGNRTATIYEVSFVGRKTIATLTCLRAASE